DSCGIGSDLDRIGSGSENYTVGLAPDDAPLLSTNGSSRPSRPAPEHGPAALNTAAREILAFLNTKAGRNYQPVRAHLDLITARLREGATVGQCRSVVGRKCAEWASDAKMRRYLRPETLFNATKFAGYVGELPASAFTPDEDAGDA